MSETPASPPPLPPEANPLEQPDPIIPGAPLHLRLAAFVLDWVLITVLAFMLLDTVLLPRYHPDKLTEMTTYFTEAMQEAREAQERGEGFNPPPFVPSEELTSTLQFCLEVLLIAWWTYFALGEWFSRGRSLGKKALGLRVVRRDTDLPPTPLETLLRSAVKSISLLPVFPIFPLLLIGYLIVFFNRRRLAGHDYMSRTQVIRPG